MGASHKEAFWLGICFYSLESKYSCWLCPCQYILWWSNPWRAFDPPRFRRILEDLGWAFYVDISNTVAVRLYLIWDHQLMWLGNFRRLDTSIVVFWRKHATTVFMDIYIFLWIAFLKLDLRDTQVDFGQWMENLRWQSTVSRGLGVARRRLHAPGSERWCKFIYFWVCGVEWRVCKRDSVGCERLKEQGCPKFPSK